MNRSNPSPVAYGLFSEPTLNWLALGLLLAAWNLSDNDCVKTIADEPTALDNHGIMTVRAFRLR